MHSFLLPLDAPDATLADAGGKGLNLAKLARAGFPVPGGFIVATAAYRAFVAANHLAEWLGATVGAAHVDDPTALEATSQTIRARFAAGVLPAGLSDAVVAAYDALGRPPVAVRSSATAEDLPDMSFAGQQDTFLNVVGEEALLAAVVACWSSLWTARAIAYRARNGISHDEVALAVVVQAMVQSEAAGVLFTANPLTGKRGETIIDATLGLGEALVGGQVEPDNYVVDAPVRSSARHWAPKPSRFGARPAAARSRPRRLRPIGKPCPMRQFWIWLGWARKSRHSYTLGNRRTSSGPGPGVGSICCRRERSRRSSRCRTSGARHERRCKSSSRSIMFRGCSIRSRRWGRTQSGWCWWRSSAPSAIATISTTSASWWSQVSGSTSTTRRPCATRPSVPC